jgi:predicted RNase H-like HicB family nuclease
MKLRLTKVFQKVPEGYIGFVEELPGANTQGETLEEARASLEEAIELVLEANRMLAEEQIRGQDVIRESVALSAA